MLERQSGVARQGQPDRKETADSTGPTTSNQPRSDTGISITAMPLREHATSAPDPRCIRVRTGEATYSNTLTLIPECYATSLCDARVRDDERAQCGSRWRSKAGGARMQARAEPRPRFQIWQCHQGLRALNFPLPLTATTSTTVASPCSIYALFCEFFLG